MIYRLISILIALFAFIQISFSQVESTTQITVHNKTPKQLYDFMLHLTPEQYLKWHPEHKEFKVITATPEIVGSIFYFHDLIKGQDTEYNWKITELELNKKISMKASKLSVPLTIEVSFEEDGSNTEVKHHLKVGNTFTKWIVKQYFLTDNVMTDLQNHVREEYANLEWMIE